MKFTNCNYYKITKNISEKRPFLAGFTNFTNPQQNFPGNGGSGGGDGKGPSGGTGGGGGTGGRGPNGNGNPGSAGNSGANGNTGSAGTGANPGAPGNPGGRGGSGGAGGTSTQTNVVANATAIDGSPSGVISKTNYSVTVGTGATNGQVVIKYSNY